MSCCEKQDMQDTLRRVTDPMETSSINFNKEFTSHTEKRWEGCQGMVGGEKETERV